MIFRVRILRRANADILNITGYIHERSPQGAAAWMNAFERAKKRLSNNADTCSEADENHRFDIDPFVSQTDARQEVETDV